MKVSEAMSRDVRTVSPNQSICDAARMMADQDTGALPVADNDRLVGMITDRDIAIRAVAQHKSPDARIQEAMSHEVLYCFDDQDVREVARNMGEQQVRRLPVVNRSKRLVGIISLADIAREGGAQTHETLNQISKPGGQHSQSTH